MEIQSDPTLSLPGESVIVVMDANRSKGSLDALDWAIKYIVRPKDTVVVLGLLSDNGKKNSSCFPFHMGISLSGIWVKLEFSEPGEKMSPRELKEEIAKKREEFQCTIQPFYRQCKKNEVKLEVKLAAGYDPREITVEETQKFNPRWLVLDSNLKKDKLYIYGHVACNVAVMKGKGVATLMPSRAHESLQWRTECGQIDDVAFMENETNKQEDEGYNAPQDMALRSPPPTPQSPCWNPLAWRIGFPRVFSLSELEVMTDGFASENIYHSHKDMNVYEGIYQETPVLIVRFSSKNDQAWSLLKIISRVRHRCILNLVGYCCTGDYLFMLCDYPCTGSLERTLQCDDSAVNLSWNARWCTALEIGAGLRYLHEDCADGPIVGLSICSNKVMFSHGSSVMICMSPTAKQLKDETACNEDSPTKCQNREEDEILSADVRDYGIILLELISGKSARYFQKQGEGRSLIDWALPLLENGSLSEAMDPRLMDTNDAGVVHHMAHAASLCLNNDLGHKFSMSQVVAVVRGDQFAITKY